MMRFFGKVVTVTVLFLSITFSLLHSKTTKASNNNSPRLCVYKVWYDDQERRLQLVDWVDFGTIKEDQLRKRTVRRVLGNCGSDYLYLHGSYLEQYSSTNVNAFSLTEIAGVRLGSGDKCSSSLTYAPNSKVNPIVKTTNR